jgi:sec-independent protein translocase protein TatC
MVLAVFSALITPTPDAVTMLCLFLPMFSLYLLGIWLCRWLPKHEEEEFDASESQEVAV